MAIFSNDSTFGFRFHAEFCWDVSPKHYTFITIKMRYLLCKRNNKILSWHLSTPASRAAHRPCGEWEQQLSGARGSLLRKYLGHSVWWWVGHGQCSGGVQAAGVWTCHGSHSTGLLWLRLWSNPTRQRGLWRQWEASGWLLQLGLGTAQLWTSWRRWSHLLK